MFGTTLGLYAVIVIAVLVRADLVALDWQVMLFRPYKQWPEVHAFLDYFVVLGQRGPTAVLVAAWLGWRSWRQRTLRPLLVLATSLLALNATVGAVKIGLGRLGPHYATTIGSAELFKGGDIFPSGHTANAVVTWGILAYLATTPRARRVLSVVSGVFALGVGATTIYLGTHWLSDVLLGWAAGLLILLGLPWFEPVILRAESLVMIWRERFGTRKSGVRTSPAAPPVAARQSVPARRLPADEGLTRDESQAGDAAVVGAHPGAAADTTHSSGTGAGTRPHLSSGSPPAPASRHPLRGEHGSTGASGGGSTAARRPHPGERPLPRTAPLGPLGE